MTDYLKGNFEPKKKVEVEKDVPTETTQETFERRALEHLGGSIAFVTLKNGFVWNGEPEDKGK
jgi:hypothetical protein